MALEHSTGLRHIYKKKISGVTLKSGYFFRFKYQAFENDPKPIVIFLTAISGTHKKSGHQWRILQCINLNYVPRAIRKRFVKKWMKTLERTKSVKLTWQIVSRRYPNIKIGIRRYFYKPSYYIQKLEDIPLENVEKVVVGSLAKDFSSRVKRKLLSKIRKSIGSRKKLKKKKRKKNNAR